MSLFSRKSKTVFDDNHYEDQPIEDFDSDVDLESEIYPNLDSSYLSHGEDYDSFDSSGDDSLDSWSQTYIETDQDNHYPLEEELYGDDYPYQADMEESLGRRAKYSAKLDKFLNNGIIIVGILLVMVLLIAFLV